MNQVSPHPGSLISPDSSFWQKVLHWHEVARLYAEEGLSLTEVGEKTGLHPTVVQYRLVRMGVPRRRRGGSRRPRAGEVSDEV